MKKMFAKRVQECAWEEEASKRRGGAEEARGEDRGGALRFSSTNSCSSFFSLSLSGSVCLCF